MFVYFISIQIKLWSDNMGRGPTKEYHKNMNPAYIKGTLTCLNPEYIKNNINTNFPLVLNIEPTNNCNLDCYLCCTRWFNSFRCSLCNNSM